MSKYRRKSRVGGTSGAMGQAESSLLPGSAQRQAMLERQKAKEAERQAEEARKQSVRAAESARPKPSVQLRRAYELPVSIAVRKYMDFMKKHELVAKARSIIERGLGRKVGKKDFEDELFDPGVTAKTFIREAVDDHEPELRSLMSEPTVDTNGDRVVDGDDEPVMTPGMSRMARYM